MGQDKATHPVDEYRDMESNDAAEPVVPLEFHALPGATIIAMGLTGLWEDDPLQNPHEFIRNLRENP